MSKAIKSLKALTDAGIRLRGLRDKYNAIEEAAKLAKDPIGKEIEDVENEILGGFKSLGVDSFALKTGEKITRSVKQGVAVTNEYFALDWAKAAGAIKIDLRLAATKLKEIEADGAPMPKGFEKVEREEVRVILPKPKKDAN